MSAIKAGDLVMVIAGRGASREFIGHVRTVGNESLSFKGCFYLVPETIASNGYVISWAPEHLKKIDPPETGDTLPTRADLDIPEPAHP